MLVDEATRRIMREEEAADRQWKDAERMNRYRHIAAELQENGAQCSHAGLYRVDTPGICDECGDYLDIYLRRGCGCNIEVCLWCSAIRLDNAEALAALRTQFMSRREIARLALADRDRAWYRFKDRQWEARARKRAHRARLRRGETLAQRDARIRRDRREQQVKRRDHMQARRERQRRITEEMGLGLAAWDARFDENVETNAYEGADDEEVDDEAPDDEAVVDEEGNDDMFRAEPAHDEGAELEGEVAEA